MMLFNVFNSFPLPSLGFGAPPAMHVGPMVMPQQPPRSSRGSKKMGGEGVELHPGAELRLGHISFQIHQPLGRGSFSSVWSAVRLDSGAEVAIKETLCNSREELQDAENESQLLQMVGNVALRSPGFIACETVQLASGIKSVRLAMAKVSGDSLGSFLQQWKQQWGGDPTSQFAEACNFTYELLVQLAPTFDAISAVALHRDVNTHNVLVSTGSGSPQFSIIDFGLAIDIQNWQGVLTTVPVVGDCRYWPVSAWYIFAHGGPQLMEHQPLFLEYRTQLDLHAFGITALQVFIDMLPQPSSSSVVSAIPEEIWGLKAAWDQYWQDAYRLWEPLFKAFERKTDWNTLRQSYIAMEAHNIIDKDLGHLRRALCLARDAYACAEPGSVEAMAHVIFSALTDLISQGAKPLGREAAKGNIKLSHWADICSIVNTASTARCDTRSRRGTSTTTFPTKSTSFNTLPRNKKVHGTTSTSYTPSTTTHMVPHFPGGRRASVTAPSMVIAGTTTRSFAPCLSRWP